MQTSISKIDSNQVILDNTKTIYTISEMSKTNLARGVFTNKKILYNAVKTLCSNSTILTFSGVIVYENKKVNYTNILNLLNMLLVNESFLINIVDDLDNVKSFEIKKLELNKLF